MYTREQLTIYPYFREKLENRRLSDVLDPLTGLVSRRYITAFVRELIERNIPFTFGMIDLDNFKYINDTYGHHIGDAVLETIAGDLSAYLGDKGIAGRYGGDEFLFINFKDLDYDDKKIFCLDMYADGRVFRNSIKVENYELFVTATTGMSSFPSNAKDYDELFLQMDKTLYRGKSKGRNCYIIYVEEKHKDIVIQELKKHSLYELFRAMSEQFDVSPGVYTKMRNIFTVIANDLHLTDMYYAGPDLLMKSIVKGSVLGSISDIGNAVNDDIFNTNNIEEIRDKSPVFCETLHDHGFETTLVGRIRSKDRLFGYLLFAEPRSLRIWQDSEMAIMYTLARMLGQYMSAENHVMD